MTALDPELTLARSGLCSAVKQWLTNAAT